MLIISVIAGLILLFSIIGGLKEGAVKSIFSLVALLISIPIANIYYHWGADVLSFLPGENWDYFAAFLIIMTVISIILYLIFILPRRLIQKVWDKGVLFNILGGVFSLIGAAVSLIVFTFLIQAYPVWRWLAESATNSVVLSWLVNNLNFVHLLVPQVYREISGTMAARLWPHV
jgi:uncharacterized membrane protein required for colicin V production